jgi:hypothetical protein
VATFILTKGFLMPKLTIEFNLPEEQDEYELAHNASKMYDTLFGFSEDLRMWLKHGHEFKTADEALEAVRTRFYDKLDDNFLKL